MDSYKFDYSGGKQFMLNLCNCPPNNQGQFTAYSNIIIHYPGYKKNGDYRLEIQGGTVPSHSDICKILHNLIVNNRYSFSVLEQLLEDIYENGTLTDYEDRNLKYLQNLIFWVTLQEEINYPRTKPWFAGRNLAFCRCYEAIYCTRPESAFTIRDVLGRCNNHGKGRPVLYRLADCSRIYYY